MGWRDAPTIPRQLTIREQTVTLRVTSCPYSRFERYRAEADAADISGQTRLAVAVIVEHVVEFVGEAYPDDFDARCEWWAAALDCGELIQLAAWVALGDLSGKSVRRVSTQS